MSTPDLREVAKNLAKKTTPSATGRNTTAPRTPPPARNTNNEPPAPEQNTDDAEPQDTSDAAPEQTTQEPPEQTKEVTKTAERAVSKTRSAAVVASSMGTRAKAGDLVQVRVQPPEVGSWLNNLVDTGAFCFNTTQGHIAGAVLLVAQAHVDDVIEILETWGEDALNSDAMRQMLWTVYKQQEALRAPTTVDGEAE